MYGNGVTLSYGNGVTPPMPPFFSNSGINQTTWEKLLEIKFEPFLQYQLLYHHHNDTCAIIHQYWLFSKNHNCSKTENNNG